MKTNVFDFRNSQKVLVKKKLACPDQKNVIHRGNQRNKDDFSCELPFFYDRRERSYDFLLHS